MDKVIGIVGHPGSGKDTIGDYLASKGYAKISMGDVLRDKMRELGLSTERAIINKFAREQRALHGNSYPAPEIAEQIMADTVVVGFRNTEEVAVFKKKFGKHFILISVETPLEVRYQRAKERSRIGDDITLEQFEDEERHERAADSGSHEVDNVVMLADASISNDGTKEELFEAVDEVLKNRKI